MARPGEPPRDRPGSNDTATAASNDVLVPDKLLLTMDYGTSTASVSYRFGTPGEEASLINTPTVHFAHKDYFVPQKVAWGKDGTFYWGYDIDAALQEKKIKLDDVIEQFKLCLFEAHRSSEMAKLVYAQLGNRTLRELVSTHLEHIIAEARRLIKQNHEFVYSEEFMDNLPVQLLLSVPQMWNAPANLEMINAAKDAGIEQVQVVYEPQCAAAFWAYILKHNGQWPQGLKIGDHLLIADPGGGTGDFNLYEVGYIDEHGAKIGLILLKEAHDLCGSEFVNSNFIAWLKQNHDVETKREELGLTPTAFVKQAWKEFNIHKEPFNVVTDDRVFVTIYGAQGAKLDIWNVPITGKDIQGFFEPVVEKLIQCMDSLYTDRTRAIVIPGGFGRSDYLLNRLSAHFKDVRIHGQRMPEVGAYQPVSRGALLRFNDIIDHGMPSNEAFGIAQIEVYDPNLHPDATFKTGEPKADGRICRQGPIMNHAIVRRDEFDWENIVLERWCPILNKGDRKIPGKAFQTETWQHKKIRLGETKIFQQIYWTETDIKEHDRIRQGADATTPLKEGIKPWGAALALDIRDLAGRGFKAVRSRDGMVYEIYYRLVMRCDGANISVRWQIAKPGTEPYDAAGQRRDSAVQLTEDKFFEICAASHNPFPRVKPYHRERTDDDCDGN